MSSDGRAYPLDAWRITEGRFDRSMASRNETIFTLANGNLGMRGNFEEGFCTVSRGTYINGFYEETPIVYGETAFGYAKNRQVMLNVADAKVMRLTVDGEPFDLGSGTILSYERTLDLSRGELLREVRWSSPAGRRVAVRIRRIVSLARRDTAAIDYEVAADGNDLQIEIVSAIEGSVENQAGRDDPRIGTRSSSRMLTTIFREAGGLDGLLVQKTPVTHMALACAMTHSYAHSSGAGPQVRTVSRAADAGESASVTVRTEIASGDSFRLTKFISYRTTKELAEEGLVDGARGSVEEARAVGFTVLEEEQVREVRRFWASADVEVGGDEAIQQGVRYNLFSLLQSAGRDGRTSVAAKGLSGEGYEGHYFWDTEIYVLPFFIYTQPEIARSLLRYRLGILDKARARAAEMGQKGALFPWRTIGGEECSPYYPAGSAQYHINADIVFALQKYLNASADRGLLAEGGAEMIFETARLWADLGDWLPERGDARPKPSGAAGGLRFYINEVTGPDEYTALVNNNVYTNLMAELNLRAAAALADRLRREEPAELDRVARRILLADEEIEEWRRAADRMYIPYDRERGIAAQDDAFLHRARWDFEGVPRDKYPLLLHFHPLVIYRYQVLKQPDVVLAQVLRGDRFTTAEKKRNFDYYDPLTTGDSSLSPCIQSVAASELGYVEKAYEYFMRTARMDLDDVNGNVADGFHCAAMAGTWISLIYGFAGMRDYNGRLSFDPRLPKAWSHLRFALRYRGAAISVSATKDEVVYDLDPGEANGAAAVTIEHRGRELLLEAGRPARVSLLPLLECVIFDLDGVITDTAELHFRAWKRIADELAIPFDRSFNERLKGVGRLESLELILEHGGKALPHPEKLAVAERKNGYYRELVATITPENLLPGILELLTALEASGIRRAIASVSHNVWEVVERLQISRVIDLIVDPSRIAKGKPDPEVFMTAADALRIPPENCAGIEDAQAGIDAIAAARMFSVGIGSELTGADWTLPDTASLSLELLLERFASHRTGRG